MKNLTKHFKSPVGVILTLVSLMSVAALREPSALAQSSRAASWTFTGGLGTGRSSHTATLLSDGRLLVAGGVGVGGVLSSAELYDPTTGAWSFTGSLNRGRFYHTATLLQNGKVLVVGGFDDSNHGALNSAELYGADTGFRFQFDRRPGVLRPPALPRLPRARA